MANSKVKWFMLLVLPVFCSPVYAQLFSSPSAQVLLKGRKEIGLFQPLRIGLTDQVEFSTHPLTDLLMPNASVKWYHGKWGDIDFATRHSAYMPTWLLRTIGKKGIGGIISPEFEIPYKLAANNEILLSRQITTSMQATLKIGFAIGLKSGKLDERTTIDLPFVFPRMSIFYHGFTAHSGTSILTHMGGRWQTQFDADVFFCPASDEKFSFEQKLLLARPLARHWQVCGGYKLGYAEYPFGTQWNMLPLLDLQYGWE
jgi:hypothetical protein